jgi:hypothetical protein
MYSPKGRASRLNCQKKFFSNRNTLFFRNSDGDPHPENNNVSQVGIT